jgi:hypothetical protein
VVPQYLQAKFGHACILEDHSPALHLAQGRYVCPSNYLLRVSAFGARKHRAHKSQQSLDTYPTQFEHALQRTPEADAKTNPTA